MNLNTNFKNIIGLKSDQEHINKKQISISLFEKGERRKVNFKISKLKNSKLLPFIHL